MKKIIIIITLVLFGLMNSCNKEEIICNEVIEFNKDGVGNTAILTYTFIDGTTFTTIGEHNKVIYCESDLRVKNN